MRGHAAAAMLAVVAVGAAPPRVPRIVSINPCADAILMRVADPAQIAGISAYSQDPRATSIPIALARRFKATSGTAEEVVALRPDIVVAGGHVDPSTAKALKRMGIVLVTYPVPTTVVESMAQVVDLARVTGHAARGGALAHAIEAAAQPSPAAPLPALIWSAGGMVPGAGTLPDDEMRRAGFRNASAGYGLKQWDVLPLEYLVAKPPRVILSTGLAATGHERLARHPALRSLATRTRIVPYPGRLMNCGGPGIIVAMAALRRVRASL